MEGQGRGPLTRSTKSKSLRGPSYRKRLATWPATISFFSSTILAARLHPRSDRAIFASNRGWISEPSDSRACNLKQGVLFSRSTIESVSSRLPVPHQSSLAYLRHDLPGLEPVFLRTGGPCGSRHSIASTRQSQPLVLHCNAGPASHRSRNG